MNRFSSVVLAVLATLAPSFGSSHGAALRETVTVVASKPIPHVPGERLVSVVVDYPPGATSITHRHARSAFIYACVLSGKVRSQVDEEPVRVYSPAEWWSENPARIIG